jgi:predicted cobalt transporter CbtA
MVVNKVDQRGRKSLFLAKTIVPAIVGIPAPRTTHSRAPKGQDDLFTLVSPFVNQVRAVLIATCRKDVGNIALRIA